ncbi:MAG TPA: heavy-metal-associated domain-containing protein [Desulfosporosinus sp.]|nr:heavy-metal-associated domain-containing protein [Desulfosporosinus sp.]
MGQTTLKVEGMTCNHCKMRVEKALQGVSGVEGVQVDFAGNTAFVSGAADRAQLIKAVVEAGYSAE